MSAHRTGRFMVAIATAVALAGAQTGCATAPAQTGQPERARIMLPPSALGQSISLQQHLRVEREGRSDELDVALEADPGRLDLVGLAMGQRVLSLHYDGVKLQSWRHAMLPEQVRAEDVIEDLQIAFWPAASIRKALPPGWRIEDTGTVRTLFSGERKVIEVAYSGQPRWIGTITLANLRYSYRLTIQSVSTTP